MQFLLHGQLSPAVAEAIKRHGHTPHAIGEVSLPEIPQPKDVLESAQARQYDLLTTEAELAEAPYAIDYWFQRSIVFLNLDPSAGDVEQDDAIDRLFSRYKRLAPARLYTVTPSRVKIRQLPHKR